MINYEFIGWCREGTHDKVWAVVFLRPIDDAKTCAHYNTVSYATIWGRRGKTLQCNIKEEAVYKVDNLIRSKRAKGYKECDKAQLDQVYPEFEQDLQMTTVWAALKA